MKKKPEISICIPTFNRDIFLDECLSSISKQFKNPEIYEKVEIIIEDNCSTDNTRQVVKKYEKKYSNVRYFKNKTRIPIAKGIISVGKHAKGNYIWYCSDDDMHAGNSIEVLLRKIRLYSPDVLFCNLNEYSKDMKKIVHRNSLEINRDYFFHNRKELFSFLNNKFFYAIDWFTSAYSNLVLAKKVFDKNYKLTKKYNGKLDLFPEAFAIFYTKTNYNIYVLNDKLIKYRSGNVKWRPENKKEFLLYWDSLLTNHYDYIKRLNTDVLPLTFIYRLFLKRLIRFIRMYILLPIFNY